MATVTGSWREHSELLGEHLSLMVGLDGSTHPRDLDVALHARSAVLNLAQAVHFDLSGLRGTPRPKPDDIEQFTHPVAYLLRVLTAQQAPAPQSSLTEALSLGAHNRMGHLWHAVARDAVLAHHEWTSLSIDDRRLGEASWTAMHELAQFTHAVARLDTRLTHALHEVDRAPDADALLRSSATLRRAATGVVDLAITGPLPEPPHVAAAPRLAALVIRRVEDLPVGLERLTHLLRTAEHISPQHVQATYRLLSRVVLTAGDTIRGAAPLRLPLREPAATAAHDDLASVEALGDLLRSTGSAPGRVHTMEPSDPVVVVQLKILSTVLAQHGLGRETAPDASTPGLRVARAQHLLSAATDTTAALREAVTRSLEDRRWLVPTDEKAPGRLTWMVSRPCHADAQDPDAPPLLREAVRAGQLAQEVAEQPLVASPIRPGSRPLPRLHRGRALLQEALERAEHTTGRAPERPQTVTRPKGR